MKELKKLTTANNVLESSVLLDVKPSHISTFILLTLSVTVKLCVIIVGIMVPWQHRRISLEDSVTPATLNNKNKSLNLFI